MATSTGVLIGILLIVAAVVIAVHMAQRNKLSSHRRVINQRTPMLDSSMAYSSDPEE